MASPMPEKLRRGATAELLHAIAGLVQRGRQVGKRVYLREGL